ncbi:unnamed protein product [Closterium sp. Naga37s-1]|nr:unnamed protein product [Closterium sp. Naga37s-1]
MAQSTWSVTASAGSVSQEEQQSGASDQPPLVVATREKGKNGKLMKALSARGVSVMELPLIQHSDGPDTHRLPAVLQDAGAEAGSGGGRHSGGVPPAGRAREAPPARPVRSLHRYLFLPLNSSDRRRHNRSASGLPPAGRAGEAPPARPVRSFHRRQPPGASGATLCALLISTLSSLSSLSALPASPATAKYLSAEIPEIEGGNRRESVTSVDEDTIQRAARAPVVAVASPTAVRAWMEVVASRTQWDGAAACVGGTSAEAARKAGIKKVFAPDSPGIESVMEALEAAPAEAQA